MTVAQYFELKGKSSPVIYGKYLNKGKLRYPALPTINIGSNKKPVWIPAELVTVPGGQSRSQVRISIRRYNRVPNALHMPTPGS